jgi:hypothetical protein
MEGYPETDMCVSCGGECCRRQPGYCLPSDFASAQDVRAAVESGNYTIVLLVDEHITARVVRPQHRDTLRKEFCIFLRADGCELSFEERPYGCRMLRPREQEGGHCEPQGTTIEEAGKMWEESGYLPPLSTCTYMPLH